MFFVDEAREHIVIVTKNSIWRRHKLRVAYEDIRLVQSSELLYEIEQLLVRRSSTMVVSSAIKATFCNRKQDTVRLACTDAGRETPPENQQKERWRILIMFANGNTTFPRILRT